MKINKPTSTKHPQNLAAAGGKTVRRFNARLALGTLLTVALLAPAAFGWHYVQLQRTAKAFVERSDQLDLKQDWIASANYLHRYLNLCPGDDAMRIRMAKTFDRGAKLVPQKRRAVDHYYQTLGIISSEEEKSALRCRLIEMLLEMHRYTEAESEAAELLKADKKSPQGLRFRALALQGQIESGAAVARANRGRTLQKSGEPGQDALESELQVFESALQSNPGDIQLSAILAAFYRSKERLLDEKKREIPGDEREKRADRLMAEMVKANPENPKAYLVRYYYRVQKQLPGRDEDLRMALKFGPDSIEVLLAAAEKAKRDGIANSADARAASFGEARAHYEHVLRIAPSDERTYLLLGDLDFGSGDYQRAVESWRRGLKTANKDSIALHQRLASAFVSLRRAEEAVTALKALDALIPLQGSRMLAADRAALECSRDFIRARLCLLQGDVANALPLLKRVANQGIESTNTPMSYEAWALLGQIWAAEEEWDRAAAAFEQASVLLPRSTAHKLAAAQAWAKADRYDTAIRYGEQALAMHKASAISLFLADTCYRQQAALPKSRRDWQPFRKALAEVVAAAETNPLPEPWRLKVLQANALAEDAMGKPADEARREAVELLRAAEKEYPKSAALLQMLPLLFEHLACPADADRVVESLGKLPDQALPAMFCRVQLSLSRKHFAEAREVLKAGLKDTDAPAGRFRIQLALSSISLAERRPEQALQELAQLHGQFPKHLPLLRRLTEMAWDLGKIEESQRWEELLGEREGADGFYWRYYRARRLLAESRDIKGKPFHEAERLVDELQTTRPSWPGAHSLRGLIEQRRGNREQAISAYTNAIRLGESRIDVYEQLTTLLYAEERFAEAEECLGQLQAQVPLSESLSSLEIRLATQAGRLDRALATARRGVEKRPKDPMAQIWLGKVLLANGQTKEAEQATRQAVQMAATDVRTHAALWAFYFRTRQLDLAIKSLEELDKNVKMAAADRAFVLAQGYEQICYAGKKDAEFLKKTSEQYKEAQRLNPNRVAVLQRRAFFLLKHDPAAAEEVLRNIQDAQKLIESPGAQASVEEQRLQAALLASRGGRENLLKARKILESLTSDSRESTADDHLLLARLLDAEGKTALAQQHYLAVVNRPSAAPSHLAQYVDFLLVHELGKDAGPWIEKVRQQLPDDLGVCELHARWLHNQRRDAEIEPAVEAVAEGLLKKPSENDQQRVARETKLSFLLGNIYTAAEQHTAAERCYRRLVKSDPQQYAPLALSLGRQNRLGEAVALCIEAGKPGQSARAAIVLATVLGSSKTSVDAEVFRLAEPLLKQALESEPKNASLLAVVADVRVLQQRTDEAIDLYRRILSLKPKDVQTLNNLATLLADQPHTRQEALHSIDEAISVAGRLPALLDTKGTILVQDGRSEDAVPLLKEATLGIGVDPRFLFHLSLACQGTGKPDEARKALQRARDGKLAQTILTSADRRLLKELEQQLGM